MKNFFKRLLRQAFKIKKIKKIVLPNDRGKVYFDVRDKYSNGWFYPRYFGNKIHEPAFTSLLLSYLNKDSVFVDIGANLGYFTCVGASVLKEGYVHSFEIDDRLTKIIRKNINLNNFNNVVVNTNAVSDSSKTIQIPKTNFPQANFGLLRGYKNYILDNVETISLDQYFEQYDYSPDVIKIDVEGEEKRVLDGMQDLLQNNIQLFVEIHPSELLKGGFSSSEVLEQLNANGFYTKVLADHRDEAGFELLDPEEFNGQSHTYLVFAYK